MKLDKADLDLKFIVGSIEVFDDHAIKCLIQNGMGSMYELFYPRKLLNKKQNQLVEKGQVIRYYAKDHQIKFMDIKWV